MYSIFAVTVTEAADIAILAASNGQENRDPCLMPMTQKPTTQKPTTQKPTSRNHPNKTAFKNAIDAYTEEARSRRVVQVPGSSFLFSAAQSIDHHSSSSVCAPSVCAPSSYHHSITPIGSTPAGSTPTLIRSATPTPLPAPLSTLHHSNTPHSNTPPLLSLHTCTQHSLHPTLIHYPPSSKQSSHSHPHPHSHPHIPSEALDLTVVSQLLEEQYSPLSLLSTTLRSSPTFCQQYPPLQKDLSADIEAIMALMV